jgi:hypothetical protein
MDVNCQASWQTFKCVWWPEMDYKHTCDTIFTHFQGITNNIYGFGRPFLILFYPSASRPPIFLPVHIRFNPSKWRVDGPLHKAISCYILYQQSPVPSIFCSFIFLSHPFKGLLMQSWSTQKCCNVQRGRWATAFTQHWNITLHINLYTECHWNIPLTMYKCCRGGCTLQ